MRSRLGGYVGGALGKSIVIQTRRKVAKTLTRRELTLRVREFYKTRLIKYGLTFSA